LHQMYFLNQQRPYRDPQGLFHRQELQKFL